VLPHNQILSGSAGTLPSRKTPFCPPTEVGGYETKPAKAG